MMWHTKLVHAGNTIALGGLGGDCASLFWHTTNLAFYWTCFILITLGGLMVSVALIAQARDLRRLRRQGR